MDTSDHSRLVDEDGRSERVYQVIDDCVRRRSEGASVSDESLLAAHPDLLPELAEELVKLRLISAARQQADSRAQRGGAPSGLHIRCPHCHNRIQLIHDVLPAQITCPSCGSTFSIPGDETNTHHDQASEYSSPIENVHEAPLGRAWIAQGSEVDRTTLTKLMVQQAGSSLAFDGCPLDKIGRYTVRALLGRGAYGSVYLAHDAELGRQVAIKVQRRRHSSAAGIELFRKEARILADLDHPHIVPAYDAGQLDDGRRYVVSKLIDGTNLAQKLAQQRLTFHETAKVVATVAEALHYAHGKKLVHRDVKPANILIDSSGKPYVTDFGLALSEDDFGDAAIPQGGTVPYMSPEQARREGHRIDGRSDLFSLGVTMYEMLTGQRPFDGPNASATLDRIKTAEALPLRMLDKTIPKELDRICMKALTKRTTERYQTAQDMAEDLHSFDNKAIQPRTGGDLSAPTRISPKGLRSFDEHDAEFFLELLPGPRDRGGLPESIRFWKLRIEETDADATFSVGLIYGPSGCGKSSLVKAGLLPRLATNVDVVYVEARPDDTETWLLKGLRKQVPQLPPEASLPESLHWLRENLASRDGKLLIVLDQFEQWLHAHGSEASSQLVDALRQCDAGRLQCLVLVRDDFYTAVNSFFRELEVPLVEGRNYALVTRFDLQHAAKVLTAFGRSYGRLPAEPSPLSIEQERFVEHAVSQLAENGKVVSVRLSLCAHMMQDRSWLAATLKDVGGIRGIGVTFLEEAFVSQNAPPSHRYHQQAARSLLKTLLPEAGANIKGSVRSYDELLRASGYATVLAISLS